MDKFYQTTIKPAAKNINNPQFKDKHLLESTSKLPSKVDMRSKIKSPIIDQGILNSCSACAISVAVELHLQSENKSFTNDGKKSTNASPLFIYYNERKIEGDLNKNTGVHIVHGFDSLADNGTCSEALWPYNCPPMPEEIVKLFKAQDDEKLMIALSKVMTEHNAALEAVLAEKPSLPALEQASKFRPPKHHELSISEGIDELRLCLSKGIPFVFGIIIPDTFFNTPPTGLMVVPPKNEFRIGGHALVAVGYDDSKEAFIVRNSYGKSFGENGYCYMPYDFITGSYVANEKERNNAFDFWCLLAD